jgi:hypothetical protein
VRWLAAIASVASMAMLLGCGAGETSQSDLDKERAQIEKQTPSNLEPVDPPKDTMMMGGSKSSGGGN